MAQIRYITLDELMASVESDMATFADEGMINRGIAVKVIRKVNEDLGLKINKERHAVIEVRHHKADLPADFQYLQLAMMTGHTDEHYLSNAGDHLGNMTQEHQAPIEMPVVALCNPLEAGLQANDCGGKFWVTQRYQDRIVEHKSLRPVRLTKRVTRNFCTPEFAHEYHHRYDQHTAEYEIDIEDGNITTSFEDGTLYLNYLTDMTDEDGNVLVLDHPLVTEYYEYSVKKHYLENWMLNSNADVAQKLMYIKNELREARLRALSFVGTIEYSQIREFFQQNRLQFAKKYYSMFSDYNARYGSVYPYLYT